MGLAKIMRLAFNGNNLREVTDQLLKRLETNALDTGAMMDLSIVLQLNARPTQALELQSEAIHQQQYFELASNPKSPALKLLVIMGPGEVMANTPIEFLIERTDIALSYLYLGAGLPVPTQIPDHDVAFVAVCESDRSQFLLTQLDQIMKHWPQPFINSPVRIARLRRDLVSESLLNAEGIVASDASRLNRIKLMNYDDDEAQDYPIIARPVNSHAGQGLEKLENCEQLQEYLRMHDDDEFFVAPFIDYRSEDGMYRKYRIAVIDGKPFAAHMAISRNWMVHYLNADMMHNQKNRDIEARFMQEFEVDFGVTHRAALLEIDRRIGLEYYSIDCAETPDGRLLVFEVDSGAVVHSMDSIELFPYKALQMQLVFEAFQNMLKRRCSHSRQMAA